MLTIYRRELKAYAASPMGYVLLSTFVAAMSLIGLYVMPRLLHGGNDWFAAKELSMSSFFAAFPWVMAVIAPALSMRAWAEEHRNGTFQLLATLPLSLSRIVVAKFLALLSVLAVMLASGICFPLMIFVGGAESGVKPEAGPMVAGYLGSLLLGGMFLAFGSFVSALCRNQLVAFILAALGCLTLVTWHLFAGIALRDGGGALASIVAGLSIDRHFSLMGQGYLRFDSLVSFASVTALFLVLSIIALERKRYQ